jgi:hypothetical protein
MRPIDRREPDWRLEPEAEVGERDEWRAWTREKRTAKGVCAALVIAAGLGFWWLSQKAPTTPRPPAPLTAISPALPSRTQLQPAAPQPLGRAPSVAAARHRPSHRLPPRPLTDLPRLLPAPPPPDNLL